MMISFSLEITISAPSSTRQLDIFHDKISIVRMIEPDLAIVILNRCPHSLFMLDCFYLLQISFLFVINIFCYLFTDSYSVNTGKIFEVNRGMRRNIAHQLSTTSLAIKFPPDDDYFFIINFASYGSESKEKNCHT